MGTAILGLFLCLGLASFSNSMYVENSKEKVVVTQEQRLDYLTWKIKAGNGTWHFETGSVIFWALI